MDDDFDKSVDLYPKFIQQSYKSLNDRDNELDGYDLNKDLSTDFYSVYESPTESHIAIKGTQANSKLPKDLVQDAAIALGSFSTLAGYDVFHNDISNIQNTINTLKKDNKNITVSGHSLGGFKGKVIGIDNPAIQTYTYNAGEGLPFISHYYKCRGLRCNNIHQSRISGDWASLVGSKLGAVNYLTLQEKKNVPRHSLKQFL